MSDNFIKNDFTEFSLWQYSPWMEKGWFHGFTGSDLNFHKDSRSDSVSKLKNKLKLNDIYFLNQTHGIDIVDIKSQIVTDELAGEGDAIIANSLDSSLGLAIGVLTADCLPLLMRSKNQAISVHAGWRGLSKGIIPKAVKLLNDYSSVEVLIGPAAGFNDYQVGSEVIEAIPNSVSKLQNNSLYLDLQQTALNQIKNISTDIKVISLSISTISDFSFHSHRRDGGLAGRNYSFLII